MSSAFMAASIAPAIFTIRPSSGNGMVLSRSLSTKNLRFGLRGGASVSIVAHSGIILKSLRKEQKTDTDKRTTWRNLLQLNRAGFLSWLRKSGRERERLE